MKRFLLAFFILGCEPLPSEPSHVNSAEEARTELQKGREYRLQRILQQIKTVSQIGNRSLIEDYDTEPEAKDMAEDLEKRGFKTSIKRLSEKEETDEKGVFEEYIFYELTITW